ncbi:MAG: hypothetical protein LBK72_05090 [Bifidobacteriaceae bacterium]|nr:hypothetical protein [Bifidobacteriaceae bacterium]
MCAIVHRANQVAARVVVALAGLPSLPRALAEAKSYSERLFVFRPVGALTDDEAALALTRPAQAEGAAWTDDGVAHVVRTASGYPYFLQQFGQDTWNRADDGVLTLAAARQGVAEGQRALDDGFFRTRWDRASPTEQAYLTAMVTDDGAGTPTGDVAARLGRRVTSLGPTRANLIAKGLIYAPTHGMVAYTVPMMASFIRRVSDLGAETGGFGPQI